MQLNKFILSLLLLTTISAHAAKFVILTDEETGAKARKIQSLIKISPPFSLLRSSEFTIEIKIINLASTPIDCHPRVVRYTEDEVKSLEYYAAQSGITITPQERQRYLNGYTINRLVECDRNRLLSLATQYQADKMIFVKKSVYEGGSGGDIPVILSGSREGIGLHEWLHTFGFADEYAFPREDAPIYCRGTSWPNVAVFNDQPPYASSDDARTRHQAQIPWYNSLSSTASLVTGDQLGSPMGNLGIFKSKTCDNVSLKTWKPTGYPTVMENPQTNYIPKPYWRTILSALGVSESRISSVLETNVTPQWQHTDVTAPVSPPGTTTPLGSEHDKSL